MNKSPASCICPVCAKNNKPDQSACIQCKSSLMLNESYLLSEVLGRNTGITYKGFDTRSGSVVIIKELSLSKISRWKEEELFTREISVLKQIDNPDIPDFIEHFSVSENSRQVFYLVEEFIDGKNLKDEMETRRYTEEEVLEKMEALLKVLAYLQDLRPPVIHRDIKPSNIICRKDGGLSLIDFGAVADIEKAGTPGTTVAGTFGYMAPEQMYGQALPESDVYAVGMTALEMITRKKPDQILDDEYNPDIEKHAAVSDSFRRLLENMTARSPKKRLNAARALELVSNFDVTENCSPQTAGDILKKSVITLSGKNSPPFRYSEDENSADAVSVPFKYIPDPKIISSGKSLLPSWQNAPKSVDLSGTRSKTLLFSFLVLLALAGGTVLMFFR